MKKKIFNGILLVAILFAASSAFVSCKDTDADVRTELEGQIALLKAQLQDLKDNAAKYQGPQGPQGAQGEKGETGAQGEKGADGLTPYIGENGNWFIGTTDTGVKAAGEKGEKGETGAQGEKGETGAQGEKGADGLTPFIGTNGNWWIGTKDTGVAASIEAIADKIQAMITEATKGYATEAQLNEIKALLDAADAKLQAAISGLITGIKAERTYNPIYGSIALPGVNPLILASYFGEVGAAGIVFPSEEICEIAGIDYNGDEVVDLSAGTQIKSTAGTLYMTVNPAEIAMNDSYKLSLVNSVGKNSVVEISQPEKSDDVLTFGWTRGEETGLYKAIANIKDNKFVEASSYINLSSLASDVKQIITDRKSASLSQAVADLYAVATSDFPAYSLKMEWNAGVLGTRSVRSGYDIAAFGVKPLAYTWSLGEYQNVPGLKGIQNDILAKVDDANLIASGTGDIKAIINYFMNGLNSKLTPVINNINDILQPTLLVKCGYNIHRANGTVKDKGTISLLPTSYSAELLAPAYKKIVVLSEIDGVPVKGQAYQTGKLGKVLDGDVQEIEFTLEEGKTYTFIYSAVDFYGNVRSYQYTVVSE